MPIYEYECTECHRRVELIQKMTDDPIEVCEACSGTMRKLIFPAGIVFKGSGFHINDYGRKSSGTGNGNGKKKPEESPKPAESTPAASTTD